MSWYPDEVERFQVRCPKDQRTEVVEVSEGQVQWCSRFLDRPNCDQGCLPDKAQPLTVYDLCHREVICADPAMTIDEVAELFAAHDISGAPVVDAAGVLRGVISTTDLARLCDTDDLKRVTGGFYRSLWQRPDWAGCSPGTLVRDIMSPEVIAVRASESPRMAVQLMLEQHIHRLLVLRDDGSLVGIITTTDLLRRLHDLLRPEG